eukprot:708487-Rhodomonas_salina.2
MLDWAVDAGIGVGFLPLGLRRSAATAAAGDISDKNDTNVTVWVGCRGSSVVEYGTHCDVQRLLGRDGS